MRRPTCFLRTVSGGALALLLGLCGVAWAGDVPPPHQLAWRQWTVADGLPQITVNAIVQDRHGYLWVGTQEGVSRFDGMRFETYSLTEHPGLGHSVVHGLAFDAEGALWIGTMGGVARLHGGRIDPVPLRDIDDGTGVVLSLSADAQGRIWVATQMGLFRASAGQLERVDTGLEREPVLVTVLDGRGPPVVVLPGDLVIDPEGERRAIPLRGVVPSILTALRTSEGLWLGTIDGLYLLGPEGEVLGAHVPGLEIERLVEDAHGRLWIASDQGLWIRDPGEEARQVEVPGIDRRAWVRSVTFDREANLWVGTQLNGLHRAYPARFRRLGVADGLPEGAVWAVYEAPDGELWAGTPDGVYRGSLAGFRPAVPVEALPHPMVVGLLKDRRGSVWLGTRHGLVHLVPGAGLPQPIPEVGTDMVASLLEDDDGSVLAGGMAGLFRIDQGQVSRIALPGPAGGRNVNALARDGRGRIWAGYEQGVAILQDGQWQAVPGPAEGGMQAMSLSPFGPDGMLAASFEGMFLLAAEGTYTLGPGHGLHIEWVTYSQLHQGELWYLSVRGIGRLPMANLAGAPDATPDTLAGNPPARVFGDLGDTYLAQCNGGHQAAGALTQGRWLWCPSLEGLLVLDLDRTARAEPVPPVRIESVATARRRLSAGEDAVLSLEADERDLRVDFTALSLRAPEQARFEGRLLGYDRDWLPLERRRSAFYTNLPPGEYSFELRAISEDGLHGEVDRISLRIAPRWHETALARAGALLLLVLAIWAGMRGRLRLVQRQRERLARLVAARTRELEAANRQLQEASLTDPLTGLHNRRFLGEHLPAEVARVDRLQSEGKGQGEDLVFLHLDLDHFKSINDRHGHAVGDEVLVEVSRRLRQLARGSDLVLRWGGEEFVLVGRSSDRGQARVWAQRVLEAIRSQPVQTRAGPLQVTSSLGYAAYPALPGQPGGTGWEQVLDLADAATYLAKADGRDRAVGVELLRPMPAWELGRRAHSEPEALEAEGWIRVERPAH